MEYGLNEIHTHIHYQQTGLFLTSFLQEIAFSQWIFPQNLEKSCHNHPENWWFDEALNKGPTKMCLEYVWGGWVDVNKQPTRHSKESSDCYHTNPEQFIT